MLSLLSKKEPRTWWEIDNKNSWINWRSLLKPSLNPSNTTQTKEIEKSCIYTLCLLLNWGESPFYLFTHIFYRSFKESERVLTKEEVLAVLTLKEKLLVEKKDELVELMKACATTKLIPEQIFSIVQFRLSDEIAKQLTVEEEDITKAMKSLGKSLIKKHEY